jgi:flagellar biosynthesis protein FliR
MGNITVSEATLTALMAQWLWPFLRIAGFVMAAPVMGTRALPVRVRVILVLAITSVLAPVVAPVTSIEPLSATGLLTLFQQVIIGATIGMVLRLTFMVFEFAGQFVAQQTGLGFAAMVDPTSGSQVPVLAHLYVILASLIFFVSDAHLILLKLLGDSFTLLPIGPVGLTSAGADIIVDWSGTLFATALLLSLPVVIALLAINLAFGVMTRAAPQLNIITIGFPVTILAGVMIVRLTLDDLRTSSLALFDAAFVVVRSVLEAR